MKASAAAPTPALEGGRREGAEQERACCPLRLAVGAGSSAALLPGAAAEPRPASPCPLAVPSRLLRLQRPGRGVGTGSLRWGSRSARGARAAGEWEPGGRGRGDRRSGGTGSWTLPGSKGPRAGISLDPGLRRQVSAAFESPREGLGRFARSLRTHSGDFGACTTQTAEDSDRSPEAKTRGSGPASGERARARAASGLDQGRLMEL